VSRFSVVIPLFNKEKDIFYTLTSVFKQTFKDYEIIIIDDGSTDSSVDLIRELAHKNIRLFSKKNEGVSIARNFGVEKANFKYIVFLDADDFWYPNHLENLNVLVETFPTHLWFASSYEKKHSNKLISPMYSPILEKGKSWSGEVSDFFKYSYIDCLAWTSSLCMHKGFFKSLSGFDSRITHGEDTDLWIRAALKEKLVFSNTITAQHNLISSNRSSVVDMKNRNNLFFEKFENEEEENSALKKYLDLNRYSLAIKHKLSNDQGTFEKLLKNIDPSNLNKKQLFLLKQSKVILILLLKIKSIIENFGLRLSSF
jgi:glycosyltransferase involved in cell wall biosynthesis